MNKIIFGGDFNPIHNGHLNMANLASKQFNADVIFVPAVVAVWKEESIPFEYKVEMISKAIQPYQRMSVSPYESTTGKTQNYSIDTVKYFVNKYPDDKFYLLIGNDQVNAFHRWKDAEEISHLVNIIYFSRPGHELSNENVKHYKMQQVFGEENDISSTDARSLNKLDLPFEVIKYIEEKELYYIKSIKTRLTDKRYAHSLQVAHLAYKIALKNELINPWRAYVAGLLHDIAKDLPIVAQKEIVLAHFQEYSDIPSFSYHQFAGSFIAKTEFNIDDKEILDAIEFHATGKADMSSLGEIIYAADKIEPSRGYDSKEMINACLQNYHSGFVFVLKENREFLFSNRKDINNRLSKACFDYYL